MRSSAPSTAFFCGRNAAGLQVRRLAPIGLRKTTEFRPAAAPFDCAGNRLAVMVPPSALGRRDERLGRYHQLLGAAGS